jgi:putative transposase
LSHLTRTLGIVSANSGRRYRLYPTPGQAEVLVSWGHTARWVWNTALEQRQMLWQTWKRTLRAYEQCGHLTIARRELSWVRQLPAQSGQQVLRNLDRAYDNWWNSKHPAGPPKFKKRDALVRIPFPGQAVALRKLNRRWAEVRLPKLGWVRLRLSRPLGGEVANATVSRDALGWHISLGVATANAPVCPNGKPGCGVDFGVACSAFVSDEDAPRLMPPTLTSGEQLRLVGLERRRRASSRGPSVTTVGRTPTDCAALSARSPRFVLGRPGGEGTSRTNSRPTSPRATATSGSKTCASRQ